MNNNSTRLDEEEIRDAINGAEQIDWPDPKPVAFALPAVRAFEDCLLPEVLRGWIADLAERARGNHRYKKRVNARPLAAGSQGAGT